MRPAEPSRKQRHNDPPACNVARIAIVVWVAKETERNRAGGNEVGSQLQGVSSFAEVGNYQSAIPCFPGHGTILEEPRRSSAQHCQAFGIECLLGVPTRLCPQLGVAHRKSDTPPRMANVSCRSEPVISGRTGIVQRSRDGSAALGCLICGVCERGSW